MMFRPTCRLGSAVDRITAPSSPLVFVDVRRIVSEPPLLIPTGPAGELPLQFGRQSIAVRSRIGNDDFHLVVADIAQRQVYLLAQSIAKLSRLIPRYIADKKCFRGEIRHIAFAVPLREKTALPAALAIPPATPQSLPGCSPSKTHRAESPGTSCRCCRWFRLRHRDAWPKLLGFFGSEGSDGGLVGR